MRTHQFHSRAHQRDDAHVTHSGACGCSDEYAAQSTCDKPSTSTGRELGKRKEIYVHKNPKTEGSTPPRSRPCMGSTAPTTQPVKKKAKPQAGSSKKKEASPITLRESGAETCSVKHCDSQCGGQGCRSLCHDHANLLKNIKDRKEVKPKGDLLKLNREETKELKKMFIEWLGEKPGHDPADADFRSGEVVPFMIQYYEDVEEMRKK